MAGEQRDYLGPYERAAERHGAGFGALLWASPATQAVRFKAICRMADLTGKSVLDIGCGRGDLLDFLQGQKIKCASYTGIEGVSGLADSARETHTAAQILQADFVAEPERLFVGAQIAVISGALNTLDSEAFYATVRHAYEAAGEMLIFNFLCSSRLAGASYLSWHRADDVLSFAQTLSPRVRKLDDYLPGDCTIAIGQDRIAG